MARAADGHLCWDEFTSLRLPRRSASAFRAAGVIWASDPAHGIANIVKRSVLRRQLRRLDLLWCLTRPQVEATQQWLGKGAPPVKFLKFGIDTGYYSFVAAPSGRPLIVSAGGDRDRDFSTLFRALARLLELQPNCDVVVQTGSKIAAPAGITVIPRLSHEELRQLYARATATIVMTGENLHASGMTVALESQATGRPVVACGTPGMDAYVHNGTTGYLVNPGDFETAAAKLARLVDSPRLASDMGIAGRTKVESEHTSASMMHSLAGLIAESLQASV